MDCSQELVDQPSTLYWCPIHHLEDDCYERKMQEKWDELKKVHAQTCKITNCEVNEKHKMISHGTCGVHVNVEFWWREMRYI